MLTKNEKKQVSEKLNEISELLSKPEMSAGALKLFMGIFDKYSFKLIMMALDECVMSSPFMPTPADVKKQIDEFIKKSDGNLEVNEAWAAALNFANEDLTVLTNNLICESFDQIRDLYESGDTIAARMAFKDAYERRLSESRSQGCKADWFVSMGFDVSNRELILNDCKKMGVEIPAALEQALSVGFSSRGENPMIAIIDQASARNTVKSQDAIAEMKKILEKIPNNKIDPDIERTKLLKEAAAAKIANKFNNQRGE